MTTEAQERAIKKWKENNRDRQRLYQNRSAARRFIREMADLKDLDELKGLIHTREQELLGEKREK